MYAAIEAIQIVYYDLILTVGTAPKVEVMLEAAQVHVEAKTEVVWIRYAGVTTDEIEKRISSTVSEVRTFYANFMGLEEMQGKTIEVYKLDSMCLVFEKVAADGPVGDLRVASSFEYRARYDLQGAERILISTLAPVSLNSARGGFHHWPAGAILPEATSLRHSDVVSQTGEINKRIDEVWDEAAHEWAQYNEANNAPVVHDNALETARQTSHIRQTYANGLVPCVRIQKDVTREEHQREGGADVALDFHSLLAGPGPALAVCLKLLAHGAPPADTLSTEAILEILGPMIDFWTICLIHRDILLAFVFFVWYLRTVSPMVLDVASAKVSYLVAIDKMHTVGRDAEGKLTCGILDGDKWNDLIPTGWICWIGQIIVVRLSESESALAVLSVSSVT